MKFIVPDHILHSRLKGEIVVLNLKNGEYYSLNESGALVWELVCSGRETDEITRELSGSYGLSDSEARSDTMGLIEELRKNGLIEEV